MSEYVPVNISKRLYEEIKKKVDESLGGFGSVEEYVEFILTEVMREEEEATEGAQMSEKEETTDKQKKLSHI